MEEDTIFNDRENNWKYVIVENNEEKGIFNDLRWKVYIKEMEDLIKR